MVVFRPSMNSPVPSPPMMTGAPPRPPRPNPNPPDSPGPSDELRDPSEREVLDRRLIDLLQRAVPLPRVVAGVSRPRIGQRLQQCGWFDAATLSGEDDRQQHQRRERQQLLQRHFSVTR